MVKMMHSSLIVILAIAASTAPGPALALAGDDTMTAWKAASTKEKSGLVEKLLKQQGQEGNSAGVIRCLDAASSVAGHAELPIEIVVAACAKEQGEPT